ncbi:uncharacterized protein LOC120915809 [Rana temporaria]|uniref:uncharacterized protein LOC120915809 n=1 Tax=Rana temporaria TaxID=8407 RepID=UPI001AAC66B2|nr:uncharacterized protein LOC120915809 [Rana temporaria]
MMPTVIQTTVYTIAESDVPSTSSLFLHVPILKPLKKAPEAQKSFSPPVLRDWQQMSKNTPSAQRTATCSANMKSPVTTTCVFSTILMIAHSLQCLYSFNTVPGAQGLVVEISNCTSSQDACIMILYNIDKRSDNKLNGHLFHTRCAEQSECNMAGSMTTAGFYISFNSTCCNTDKCVPPRPLLQERSLIKNGVTCPACHVEKQDPCVPERAMACTGEETHCVFQTSTMYRAYKVYSYGCATQNIFKNNGEFVNSFSLLTKFVIQEISSKHQLPVGKAADAGYDK